MKKGLLIGGGVVAVAIAAVVIFLISSIDSLVKTAVEEFGSRATKTRVTLNEVEISTSGIGVLRGFTMGNPAGFKTESAARLGEIRIDIDVGTITDDVVVIREIVITGPEITYELGSGGSNIDVIRKNVEDFTGGAAKGGSGGERKAAAGEEGGTRLIIENLYVRDGKINVSATFLEGKTMTIPLPAIHLKDIGKDKGGAAPGEVVVKILAQISKSAGSAISSLDLGKAMDAAKQGVEGAKKLLEEGAAPASSGKAPPASSGKAPKASSRKAPKASAAPSRACSENRSGAGPSRRPFRPPQDEDSCLISNNYLMLRRRRRRRLEACDKDRK